MEPTGRFDSICQLLFKLSAANGVSATGFFIGIGLRRWVHELRFTFMRSIKMFEPVVKDMRGAIFAIVCCITAALL